MFDRGLKSFGQSTEPVSIVATVTSEFPSQVVGETFKIDVALPYTYRKSEKRYPVIYLTDGNGYFSFVVGNLRMLQLAGEMPDVIVVGIGYSDASVVDVLAKRQRDLTPTLDANSAENSPMPEGITSGGADKFLEFINTELKPVINQSYRTDPDDETVVGYSLGGLFSFHVLMNHTDAFDKYVIGSPSLWWDKGVSFQYESVYAASHDDLAKRVFMSVGSLEQPPGDTFGLMISNMTRMAELLESRKYPGLVLDTHIFDGETHQSGIGTALNRGLRKVFKDQMPPPPEWMSGETDTQGE
jgi:predicted alpha/beta superfamily hydrolase